MNSAERDLKTPHGARDLASLLELRADTAPDRLAYRYLGQTAGPGAHTYSELRHAARAIAAELRDRARPGSRALLLYPPGLEFIDAFLGCACAGVIAVPAPPPNPLKPERSLQRLAQIVESAQPSVALTVSSVMQALEPALPAVAGFEGVRWLCTDRIDAAGDAGPPLPAPKSDDIALIQYTSGSTSEPKGVALSHANILHNVRYFDEEWEHGPDAVLVNWLPAFHDLGLVYGILAPLWGGFAGLQMSPIDVIRRPLCWLEALSAERATHSTGPNFIYELCVRKVSAAEASELDLSHWRVALTAAEPVRAETMERFTRHFAVAGFRPLSFCPGYGLSEATCKVAAVRPGEAATVLHLRAERLEQGYVEPVAPGPGTRAVVGCGRPGHDLRLEIVDPETCRPRAVGEVGEIWVSGPHVGQSYWEQPQATEQQLRARLQGHPSPTFLRTGDLGFAHDGQLFITGRIKDMIIVRGANHYPQDIESTVQSAHASIRAGCCAAFGYDEDGEERLAIVAEADLRATPGAEELRPEEVIATLIQAVAEEHGLRAQRVALIRVGTILKTTSGKIQRQACKRALLGGKLAIVAEERVEAGSVPSNGSEREALREKVTALVSEVAAIPIERLRPDEPLHRFGLDSLTGVNVAYEIELLTGRKAPSELVTEHDTIDKLVDYVISTGGSR